MSKSLTFKDIIDNITEALSGADGKFIAEVHNEICSRAVTYVEDSVWKYDEIEKDDDGNCIYCGQKCWNGEMCDEQQAGGFNNE